MGEERSHYGVDETLRAAVKQLTSHWNGASEELDRIIQQLGAHHVAHFLVTTVDSSACEALREYLGKYWPAYFELIERLIRAARRSPENEDLQSDFGES
jgi:hypothetical protein